MKLSALFISGLTLLAASAASADSFVSIAVTGASSATVTNRWLIGSGLSGLGYIDGNGGYSSATVATNFYTITGAAIPAGGNPLGFTSYLKTGDPTPQSSVGNSLTPDSYSGLTYVAANLGLISSLSFYTIHHRATGDYLALIQPATPTVSDQKPMSTSGGPSTAGATGYFALSYADDDPGLWGANLFYYLRTNSLGETVFGSMIPALLSGPTDRWNLGAGKGYTDLAYTSTATISGNPQYTQQFYYLRLDPVTHTSFLGKINPATGVATDIQNLGAVYRTLTFTTTDVGYGPNNFYAIAQPAAQTISFAPIPDHTACDAPFTFVAPTATSGLPVTVTASGPATLSAGNVVTLTGVPGTVTLTATQAGNSSFNPAVPLALSFTVTACAPGLTAQTITFAPLANHTACDAPFSFVYPTASSGLPVTVTVSGPATVSAGNVVTLTGTSGTVTLTATQAGNSSFNPAAAVAQSFTVAACAPGLTAQTITFAPLANHTACDAPFSFVYPTATSGLPVTLAVSGPASVSGGNVVTLTGATGTVTLVATQAGNGTFAAAAPVTQHFAVSSCAVALAPQTISFAPVADHTACDVAFSFVYPVASSGLPVTVVATGPATVSAGNVITLSGVPGVVTLTATQAGNAITSPAAPVTISFAVAACGAVPVITSPHDVQAGGQPVSPNVLYGVVGVPFPPYTITATNLPTTFSAVNLPPGLSLNPLTGSITGTPTVADTWFVTIGATNPSGTGTATLIIVVRSAAIPQTITFAPIPSHTACDSPFTFVYPTASSGLPVTVAVTGPATVTAGNVVSVTGVGTVTLTASQGGNDTSFQAAPNVVQTFTVTACPPTPVITSPHDVQAGGKPVSENVVTGTVGTPITPYQISASGSPTSFAATLLPPGLSLNTATGVISGTPTAVNTWFATIGATNSAGTGTATLIIVVGPPAVPTSRIVNFSTMAPASSGSQALNMGFVVSGNGKTILVRGVGPALSAFGVPNPLADPLLTLYGAAGVVASNDDWQTNTSGLPLGSLLAATTQVGAFPLQSGSKDSALLVNVNGGPYTANISGQNGGSGTALAEVYDADTVLGAKLVNVSARISITSAGATSVVGLEIAGNAPKTVLVRAAGPSLAAYGVTGTLADPSVSVYSGATQIATNDNWETGSSSAAQITGTSAQVGAFPFSPGSKDAALLVTLPPGGYTVTVTGPGTGVALVEIYDTQ